MLKLPNFSHMAISTIIPLAEISVFQYFKIPFLRRPEVANFANNIKITIRLTQKTEKKCIKVQF